jgi:TonB family protein
MLHVGLAVILLGSDTIKPINEPVFMEVLMLSVPAATTTTTTTTTTATQTRVKAVSPIKKVPIFPPSISKKPSPLSIKKPVMIIPTDATGSSPSVTEAVSVEKAEPLSDPVSKDTAVTSQSAETIVKSIGPNSHEHDADKSVVISGIMPLIKVNPIYPNRAVSHGIEGWVRIEFTIQADGSVTDAVVVKAMPEDVFDDAALTAINQWQFKPKMVNGVAVPQRAGQQLQFKLDH